MNIGCRSFSAGYKRRLAKLTAEQKALAQVSTTKGQSTVGGRLEKLLDENKWTDITFLVGSPPDVKVVEAHRLVIAAASPVFEAMCFGGLAEGDNPVPVPDVTPVAFKAMLQHIYTDSVQFKTAEVACEVLQAARKYLLPELKAECVTYLVKQLSAVNACLVLESSVGEEELKQASFAKIRSSADEVLSSPGFVHIRKETLELLLDQDQLQVSSEVKVLDACVRWAEQRCLEASLEPSRDQLRLELGCALSKIRFLTMKAEQLVSSSGFEKLLTDEEARKILANIVKPRSCNLPDTICTSVKTRSSTENKCNDPYGQQPITAYQHYYDPYGQQRNTAYQRY